MSADLEVTTVLGCRMMCSYCPQPLLIKRYAESEHTGRVMTLDDFKKCLSTVPVTTGVSFAGMAEPWLNPACTDMVLHVVDKGHVTVVYTTAMGMTMQDVERLKGLRFKHLCLHLPDAEGRMTLPVTDDYLEVLVALAKSHPEHNFALFGPLHPDVRRALGRDVPDSTVGLHSRAGNLDLNKVPRRSGKLDTRHCINHNMLLPNGDVALCCQDYGLKHVLGNLLRQDYSSIFEGPEFVKLMRGMTDESIDILCRTCNIALAA
jgi:Iron-sulfur cluster-binding domain